MHADRTNRLALAIFGLLVLLTGALGIVASAGGFEGDPELYSACVFKTSFADETRRAMEQDPAVRSGRLAVEFHRWWTADRVLPWWGGRRFVIGQPSPPEQTRWHQAMRVLIVDDEPSIRRTTRVAVESSGHSASEAPNAAKAVKAAEEEGSSCSRPRGRAASSWAASSGSPSFWT